MLKLRIIRFRPRLFVVLATGTLFAVACVEDPMSSNPPTVAILFGLGGADTSTDCKTPATSMSIEEWSYVGHVPDSGVVARDPDTCWEYTGGTFDVDFDFVFNDNDHPDGGWYRLLLFGRTDHTCPVGIGVDTLGYVGNQATVAVDSAGQWRTLSKSNISFPTGAECAYLAVQHSTDTLTEGLGNFDIQLRVFSKLSPPSSLAGTFEGDSILLTWTNNETVSTEIFRKAVLPDSNYVLIHTAGNGTASWGDTNWAYSTKYSYKVRHRSPEPEGLATYRLSNYSSDVTVDAPQGLVGQILGPDEVNDSEECAWVATTSGGTPPYSYAWTGIITGSTSIVTEALGMGEGGWLYLTVTDDNEWESYTSLKVTVVASGAPTCELR